MKDLIHGAKWWKFDFHNHTPASNDFGKGNVDHKNITPEEWLLMYMNAEIDCVAITDHNSGEWIDKLQKALRDMETNRSAGYRRMYLFPGVEITVSGNTHILAIFDPKESTSKIQTLLGAVGFPASFIGTSDAVTEKTVELVINEINKAGGIAIPAHVDKPCGLFISQSGHTLKQSLGVDGLLAIELIDKNFEKPDIYLQSNIQLAEIIGTDSHIASQVGTNYTWVKMGKPALDDLRFALYDKEDGIKRKDETTSDPNTLLNRYFIKSLSINNGFKAGNGTPLSTVFSPWLNSVIGGRGSGKSTVINYLRIVFARINDMPNEVQSEFDKFNQIGKKSCSGMLRNETSIDVEVFKDGKLYLIRWNNKTYTLQEWDSSKDNWGDSSSITNIKELFPIQIFNQKELYALTRDPSKLIELIDSQFDKPTWERDKGSLINKWIVERGKFRELEKSISQEANFRVQLSSVDSKIALFESSEYKEILSAFNKYTLVNKFYNDTSQKINKFIDQIEQIEKEVPNLEIPSLISDVIVDHSLSFVQNMNNKCQEAKSKIIDAIDLLAPYKENLNGQINSLPWFNQFNTAKQSYESIAEKIKELGSQNYETLLKRKTELNKNIQLIETQKGEFETLKLLLKSIYDSIIDKEKELRVKRNDIISRWSVADNSTDPFLIIELQTMSDADSAESTLRGLLRKQNKEFANDIYRIDEETGKCLGLIAEIIKEDEANRWDKRMTILKDFLSATELDKKKIDLRLAKHLDSLKQNTPEDIDRLYVWVPEDRLVLKFKKQGREEDIQTGSAGERTAGMLGLLLALNNIPLIIDQPEDDLDTKLISNFVVNGFKKIKQNRQLILVTHNPNIAVNANSDNIIYMDFISGQVTVAANDALQNRPIRNAVCEVMEGGREALNKRYYRISKALK